ncbi:uncharacterized protein LOC111712503 [Eurytemora carolleeae]|uniref:uncharacterized protein LOC111712503 n=1 Tax=Eurytemora carolleeae TaxID=1294199 RepID=UPI000C7593EC|nr:uncharacterized protein LOC111712503 [Eurytemora carolleeae]|eukprot:XP_023342907.1 uncharacterized protein LOC111712503 [Eurytemora affinis]
MSVGMYALNPVFNLDSRIDLPTCMYSLPVIQISKSTADGLSGDVPPQVLQALAARQEAILTKLENLRAEVLKFTKSAGISTKCLYGVLCRAELLNYNQICWN